MSAPTASVVLTTKNRVERLGALIASLREQELEPSGFEVVVVDNASSDGTADLLRREQGDGSLLLRAVRSEVDRGTAASRNLGWRAARGSLIAFTDDDCELHRDWLIKLIEASRRSPGAILQGRTEPIERERLRLGPLSRTKEVTSLGPYFETCNIAYPRELLERLGGFDSDAFPGWGGEDTDLAWRAFETGAEATFVDEARAYHAVNHLGVRGTLRLALAWSDAMRVFARHPGMRKYMHRRVFLKRSHQDLLAAVAGLVFARRATLALLLLVPYVRLLAARVDGRPWLAPVFVTYDALELFSAVRGGIRARTLII